VGKWQSGLVNAASRSNRPYMDSSRKSARKYTIVALIEIGCSRISGLL
jgi:hypothetical protein